MVCDTENSPNRSLHFFFLCGRGPEEKFCNDFFVTFFYRASVLSEVQTSRNSQLPASKNLLVLGKKTVFWFFVKIQEKGFCRCFLTEKCFCPTFSIQDGRSSSIVNFLLYLPTQIWSCQIDIFIWFRNDFILNSNLIIKWTFEFEIIWIFLKH